MRLVVVAEEIVRIRIDPTPAAPDALVRPSRALRDRRAPSPWRPVWSNGLRPDHRGTLPRLPRDLPGEPLNDCEATKGKSRPDGSRRSSTSRRHCRVGGRRHRQHMGSSRSPSLPGSGLAMSARQPRSGRRSAAGSSLRPSPGRCVGARGTGHGPVHLRARLENDLHRRIGRRRQASRRSVAVDQAVREGEAPARPRRLGQRPLRRCDGPVPPHSLQRNAAICSSRRTPSTLV